MSIMVRNRLMIASAVFALLGLGSCATPMATAPSPTLDTATLAASMCGKPSGDAGGKAMPLIAGLAPVHYEISSTLPKVQSYFDQGLALLYGFEYEAAYDSFKAARKLDPNCAMCTWGMAMALGPNINNGDMSDKDAAEARGLVAKALTSAGLSDRDHVLLEALAVRYAPNPPKEAGHVFAQTYADALIAASERWPADDFIAILAAEAAMDVNPWDYWETGGHVARPWGGKAMALVETVLKRNPNHPEAIHLYIHLTENSDNPRRAEAYADRLGALAPNSPHLIHMPSHTYYPLGRFADSIRVNEQAIAVDEGMARDLGADPAWYGYYFHHSRFIMSAAQQVGDRATALRVAAEMERGVPLDKALKSEWSESTLALTLQARGQFQSPAEILALPTPDRRLKIVTVVWHASRAEAYARLGDVSAAHGELAATAKARKALKSKDWQNFAQRADEMAQGRVALVAGDNVGAAGLFRTAAQHDGEFDYSEPPLWDQPAETALGRALLAGGDAAGAKAAFDRALTVRPGNAYALWGRAQAEVKLGDAAASQASLSAFDKVWLGDKGAIGLDRL
ncbi:hypothetical protein [Asticcacaulis sp. 201]|uniref:tetratricopeptide repeat protein n=1 Tax=Asticcacaulis sp. 201 TaxID=3028787 RepID=UPI0029164B3B|nr:hypothetical protein [Asticcacaulis sp. 201]MDV6332861.1 hypothetical protein [Asticcacaulis sp. 201]